MNCDEAEGLLGAYALDALPADEERALRAHLEGCADHRARALELRGVAVRMAAVANAAQPPAALRARVVDAIAREARGRTAVMDRPDALASPISAPSPASTRDREAGAPTAIAPATPARRHFGRTGNIVQFPAWALNAAAAVLVAVAGGLLVWNVVLMNRLGDDGDDAARFASRVTSVTPLEAAAGAPAGATGYVLYVDGEKQAVVVGEGLRDLGESQTYQLWAVTEGGQAQSLGLMQADEGGRSRAVAPFNVDDAGVIAVTIEPRGGSDQPSSAPIFSARIERS